MTQKLVKEDIADLDLVDARELLSDGTDAYQSAVGVVSTTSGTQTVVVSGGLVYNDNPVEPNDLVTLAGTSGADGDYTIATVVDDTSFTVVEAIATSSGGTATFKHPAAATRVGVDPTTFRESSANTLQALMNDLELTIRGQSADPDGPITALLSGAYRETLPAANPFPTSVIWWETASKLKKLVEKTITRAGGGATVVKPTPIVWKIYEPDGTTVRLTISDAIAYTAVFETSRTRTIT